MQRFHDTDSQSVPVQNNRPTSTAETLPVFPQTKNSVRGQGRIWVSNPCRPTQRSTRQIFFRCSWKRKTAYQHPTTAKWLHPQHRFWGKHKIRWQNAASATHAQRRPRICTSYHDHQCHRSVPHNGDVTREAMLGPETDPAPNSTQRSETRLHLLLRQVIKELKCPPHALNGSSCWNHHIAHKVFTVSTRTSRCTFFYRFRKKATTPRWVG